MLRVHNNGNGVQGFTEYEEDIHFDDDDPDFDQNDLRHQHHVMPSLTVPIFLTVPTKMSLASVHPVDLHSSHSSLTLSHSLDDVSSWSSSVEQVMTIEQLRYQLTSCFTCGVSWTDSHVSLDCSECGGYSMERPCPECDGHCGSFWKRDLTMSHSSGKARWVGECMCEDKEPDPGDRHLPHQRDGGNLAGQAQELCQRLEKLTAANS